MSMPLLSRVLLAVVVASAAAVLGSPVAAAPATTLPNGMTVAVQDDHFPVTPEANIAGRVDLGGPATTPSWTASPAAGTR
jgi:hypothetical protein